LNSIISTNQYFANSHILKSNLQLNDVILANVLVLFTTVGASIYPALKAAYSKPVQAISSISLRFHLHCLDNQTVLSSLFVSDSDQFNH